MAGTRFIEHHGVRILFLDYAGVQDRETALALIRESQEYIATLPQDGTLLTLTNVEGSHFDTDVLKAIRTLAEHNTPWVRAAAVVGLTGLLRVVFNAIVQLTGRELRAFDDLDTAKDYLSGLARTSG